MKLAIRIILFVFFTLLLLSQAIGQENRQVVYCDQDLEILTKAQFEQLKQTYNPTILQMEDDSLVVYIITSIRKEMHLNSTEYSQITTYLKKIIGDDFNPSINTMIYYFVEEDSTLKSATADEKYWRWMKANRRHEQAFLIGAQNSNIIKKESGHLYNDCYAIIRSFFFHDSIFKINHLYIKNTGAVIIHYGDRDLSSVLDGSIE